MSRLRPLAVLLPMAFLACQAAFQPARPRWPPLPDGHYMHVGDFLQVTGTGRPTGKITSDTQGRALAREAALLDGWKLLLDYIRSLPMPDGVTAGTRASEDPAFKKRLDALVQRAAIVKTEWDGSSSVAVLRLSKTGINRALGTEFR